MTKVEHRCYRQIVYVQDEMEDEGIWNIEMLRNIVRVSEDCIYSRFHGKNKGIKVMM